LLESLVNNHPFVDGNKRTGDYRHYTVFAKFIASQESLVTFVLSVAQGMETLESIAIWLKTHANK
jgi:death on curing protein